MLQNIAIK